MPSFQVCTLGELRGMAGFRGFGEVRLNTAGSKNAARFIEHGSAAMPAVPGVGVVNQQRVMDFRGHPQFGLGSGSFLALLILYNVRRN